MKRVVLISALIFSLIALESCKKETSKEEETYDNSSAPKSNAIIESAYDDMTNMTDQAINGDLIYYKSPKVTFFYPEKENEVYAFEKVDCNVVVTVDTLNTTKTITIDWGDSNCDCNDQKQRRGKIVTTFTGKYRDVGTVITHTPVNYYVNDNKVEGTKTVTNMGLNSSNQPYYNVSVSGIVTMTNGDIFTYSSTRVRTWTVGADTFEFLDDEYDIMGSTTASSTNGNGYTSTITTPLHVKIGCGFVTSGILQITPINKPLRVIDYGNGTCDNTFTVTINGNTYTING